MKYLRHRSTGNKQRSRPVRLISVMTLFSCLCMTGCFYRITLWGEQLNALNTDLDRKLRYANGAHVCFSSRYFNERWSKIDKEILERSMVEILHNYFPIHMPLKQVTERLKLDAGADCITNSNKNSNSTTTQTICSYSYEFIQGMKKLGLTGWEILDARWQKNNFQFEITSQDDHLINWKAKVLEGQCYDIDVSAYKSTKTINFIRKLP